MELRLSKTILIATCLYLTSATVQNSDSNRSDIHTEDTRLSRLYPLSIDECMDTCFYNQECQSVVFTRLTGVCELQSTHKPPKEQSGRGSIFLTRNDIDKRRLEHPTANPATRKYTKVCPLSDFTGYKRLGNRNRPGDRVILVDYGNDIPKCTFTTFTCAETGEWNQTDCRNRSTSTATAWKRLRNLRVTVGDNKSVLNKEDNLCGYYTGPPSSKQVDSVRIKCSRVMYGRYLKIEKQQPENEPLILCEVQVTL